MKKLFFTLLILLFALPAYAQQCTEDTQLARLSPAVIGSVPAEAPACDPLTNEVGYRSPGTTTESTDYDRSYCTLVPADCTGTLTDGYIYSKYDNGSSGKICVYAATGASPVVGDTLMSCSGLITDAAATLGTSAMDNSVSGAVVNLTNYWVCIFFKTAGWDGQGSNTGATGFDKACTGCADTPPANLDGTWSADTIMWHAFVSIQ